MPESKWCSRTAVAVPLAVLLASGLVACSLGRGSSNSAGNDSSKSQDEAEVDDRLQKGLDAHAEGDLEKARSLYGEVIDDDPENAFAHYNLGLLDQTDGELKDADVSYRKALEVDPAMSPALFNLALVRTDEGAFDEAVELYQRAITADPEMAPAHLNLGLLLNQAGRSDEAGASLARAAELDPDLAGRAAAGPDSDSDD